MSRWGLLVLFAGCGGNGSGQADAAVVLADGAPIDVVDPDALVDAPPPTVPSIVTTGTSGAMLLRGHVVGPMSHFEGEVLVEGNLITCVAASCAGQAGATNATVVETAGFIFPGLIDAHEHTGFGVFDHTDWTPLQPYQNHNQWPNEPRYGALVDAKQYLNGEGSPIDVGCEMVKYSEVRHLLAGTTSVVGAPNPANRSCYGSLARTIDQAPNGLPADRIQVATLFPSTATADSVCSAIAGGTTTAYVIHIAEGIDATSRNEFTTLGTVTTTDGCLYDPATSIVNGISLEDAQLTVMGQEQMSLVWSPRHGVTLYGGGTDKTKTANVPLAVAKGINIALATDWAITGSRNLFDELRYADSIDATVFGNTLTAQQLTNMVTMNAAKALHLEALVGSLEVGKRADLTVLARLAPDPYDAMMLAHPKHMQLVLVDGKPLAGHPALQALAPVTPGCESLDVCGISRFVCVAATSSAAIDKLDQTFATIQSTLSSQLTAYDDLNLSQWDFAPVAPLFDCP